MDSDSHVVGETIHALLVQQLRAAENVIALNQAITKSLGISQQPKYDSYHYEGQKKQIEMGRRLFREALQEATFDLDAAALGMEMKAKGPSPASIMRQSKANDFGLNSSRTAKSSDFGLSSNGAGAAPVEVSAQTDLAEPLLLDLEDSDQSNNFRLQYPPIVPRRRKPNAFCKAKTSKKKPAEAEVKTTDYNVEDLYKDTGFGQWFARNMYFQNLTLVVIVFNTIWMSIDTDYNRADVLCEAPVLFQIMDNFFCAFFSFEIFVRFCAFINKLDAAKDFWFVFDASLVLLMIWETWIQVLIYLFWGFDSAGGMRSATVLRLFRAFRLLRISRMTRLLRSMPELFILVKSIWTAMRCMFFCLLMLIIVIYVFSIMFTQLARDTPVGHLHFATVPEAMNFMLLQVLCGFDADFVYALLAESVIYYILWLIYVLIGSLSIMNVLIGILCEVVSGTADSERERAVRTDIAFQIHALGIPDEAIMSKPQMVMTLESQTIERDLEEIGIDVHALLDFVHYFEDSTEMHLHDFVDLCVQFRGTKFVTVNDVVNLRKYISTEVALIEDALANR